MPRLDVLDEEFGEDAAAILQARRRRIGTRLLMLAIVALGLGAIGALAFAWSNADGPLRFELQSAATAPKSAQRAAAQEEIERLRGELDALKNDVKELTEAQHQAAHTIATMKAAEEDLRRDVPPPYWYSNPATLDLAIANQPQWGGVSLPPPPPGDRALRIARSAQARRRNASIAGVSAVTTRADVAISCHGEWSVKRPEKPMTGKLGQTVANDRGGARDSGCGRRHLRGLPKPFFERRYLPETTQQRHRYHGP